MQKKVIALLSMVFSFNAYSVDAERTLHFLRTTIEPKIACDSSEGRNFSQCLSQVCGPANESVTYGDVINQLDEIEPENNAQSRRLQGQIEEFYTLQIANSKESLRALRQRVQSDQVSIDPEFTSVNRLSILLNILNDLDSEEFTLEEIDLEGRSIARIDQSKLRKALVNHLGERGEAYVQPYIEFRNNPHFQRLVYGAVNGWQLYLDQNFPGKTLQEAIEMMKTQNQQSVALIRSQSERLSNYIQTMSMVDISSLNALENEENPSNAQLAEFFSASLVLSMVKDFIVTPPSSLRQIPAQSLYDFYTKEDLLRKIDERLVELENLNAQSPEIQANVQHCLIIQQKSQEALPSHAQRQEFLRMLDAYKNEFKRSILGRLSTHSTRVLSPLIDRINFDVPTSREGHNRLMTDRLAKEISDLQRDIEYSRNNDQQSVSVLNAHEFMNMSLEEFTSDVTTTCDEFELGGIEDHSQQVGSGKIKVSWLSLKVPEMGKGIIAHELGHALSSLIRANTVSQHSAEVYRDARLCLNVAAPEIQPAYDIVPFENGETKESLAYRVNHFTEENWADLISARFLSPEDRNFACFLINKDSNGNYNSNTFFASDAQDTHSPDLYRVLKVERFRGRTLPPSCTAELTAVELQNLEQDCFK